MERVGGCPHRPRARSRYRTPESDSTPDQTFRHTPSAVRERRGARGHRSWTATSQMHERLTLHSGATARPVADHLAELSEVNLLSLFHVSDEDHFIGLFLADPQRSDEVAGMYRVFDARLCRHLVFA